MRTTLRPFIPRVLRLCINKNSDFIKAITEKYVILSSEEFPAVDLIYFLGENDPESYDRSPDFLVTSRVSENTINEEIKQIAINRYYLNTDILFQIYSYRDGNVTINSNVSKSDHYSRSDRYTADYLDTEAVYNHRILQNSISKYTRSDYRSIRNNSHRDGNVTINSNVSKSDHYSRSDRYTADYLNIRVAYNRRMLQNSILKYTVPDYRTIWNISVNQQHPEEAERLLYYIDNAEEAGKKVMLELLGLTQDNYRQILHDIKDIRFEEMKRMSIERAMQYEQLEPAARLMSEYINRGKGKNRYSQKALTKVIRDIHTGRIKPEKILQTVYGKTSDSTFNSYNTAVSTIKELSENNEGFSFFISHGVEAVEAARKLAEILITDNRKEAAAGQTERKKEEKEEKNSQIYLSQNSYSDAVSVFYEKTGGSIENYFRLTQLERMQLKTDFLSFIEKKENEPFAEEIIRDMRSEETLQEEAKGWISFPDAEKEYLKESENNTIEKNTERMRSAGTDTVSVSSIARAGDNVQELSQWIQYMTQETWDNTVRLIFRNTQNIKKKNNVQSVSMTLNNADTFSYSGYLRDVFHLIDSSEITNSELHYAETKQEKKKEAPSFDIKGPVFIDNIENNAETVFPYQYPDMVIAYPGAAAGTNISPAATGDILKKTEAAIQSVREEVTDITKIRRNVTESSTDVFEKTVRKLTEQVDQQRRDIKRMEENQNLIIRNTDTALLTERVLRNLNRQVYLEKLRKGIR